MEEKTNYGEATLGVGGPEERKVPIESWMEGEFNDGRIVTVVKLQEDTYALTVRNVGDNDRNPRQEMLLTEDSLLALMTIVQMHWYSSDRKPEEMLENAMKGKDIQYRMSDNLMKIPNDEA